MEEAAQHFQRLQQKLVPYTIACIHFFMKQPETDGDFPEGEAQGGESASEAVEYHGIAPTFLLDKFSELYLLEAGSHERLLEYLKVTRMPGAKKYARQIKKLYQKIILA